MESISFKECLLETAYRKLECELTIYKQKMYQLTAKEVFDHAYEIDAYINIYETLLMKIEYFTLVQLGGIIMISDILGFFYSHWLDVEDSRAEELDEAIDGIIEREIDFDKKLNFILAEMKKEN